MLLAHRLQPCGIDITESSSIVCHLFKRLESSVILSEAVGQKGIGISLLFFGDYPLPPGINLHTILIYTGHNNYYLTNEACAREMK